MHTRLKVEQPGEVEFTMTITMKAREWEALYDELSNKWPASTLSYHISDLLGQARRIFWSDEPSATNPGASNADQ
jgi:hypothetical protein